jgi:selT/selW/selH-like putative selenoprotein
VTLVKGRNGVFDITIDGKLAYSKKETGSFPSDDEVRALL